MCVAKKAVVEQQIQKHVPKMSINLIECKSVFGDVVGTFLKSLFHYSRLVKHFVDIFGTVLNIYRSADWMRMGYGSFL